MLRYTTDRAKLGLVAFYDIRPGNGAGQLLQPRSPHGAVVIVLVLVFVLEDDGMRSWRASISHIFAESVMSCFERLHSIRIHHHLG